MGAQETDSHRRFAYSTDKNMNPGEVNVKVHYPDADNTGDNIMDPFRGATVKDVWTEINDFMGVHKGDVIVKTSDGELLPDDGNTFLIDITDNKDTLRLDVSYAVSDEHLGGTENRKFELKLSGNVKDADATLKWTRTILKVTDKDFKRIKIKGKSSLELPTEGRLWKKKASFVILQDEEEKNGELELTVKKFILKKDGPVRIEKTESSPDNGFLLDTDKIFLNDKDITDEGTTDLYYGKFDQAKKSRDDYNKEFELQTKRMKEENGKLEVLTTAMTGGLEALGSAMSGGADIASAFTGQ